MWQGVDGEGTTHLFAPSLEGPVNRGYYQCCRVVSLLFICCVIAGQNGPEWVLMNLVLGGGYAPYEAFRFSSILSFVNV